MNRLLVLLLVALLGAGSYAAYRVLESHLTAEVYRARLAELAADHEVLRERYNHVVRRTAVTELIVDEVGLQVVIRTVDGELQRFVSPYDPEREIYVDYVVRDGRIFIRRLFDDKTPPGRGMVIDPELVDVDWGVDAESYGKAAYRALGPGRWVVDVTGDGSLGLARREPGEPLALSPPPEVRQYEPIEGEVREALREITIREAVEAFALNAKLWSRGPRGATMGEGEGGGEQESRPVDRGVAPQNPS